MARASVLLIYTGGTIGMKTDLRTGVLTPFDFNGIYDEFPSLKQLEVDIEVLPFVPIDSSNATLSLCVRLAEIIRDAYDRFDGFVVLHGTDTMSYTSSALSFMLMNLNKPVVFTGSQIPIGVLRTDGRENLITAIEIAAAKHATGEAMVPEVCLYFQNRLFRANRTKKLSAEELNAFVSYNYPPLAEVGVNIHYRLDSIRRWGEGPFGIDTRLGCEVMIVKIFPGLTECVFRSMLAAKGLQGVVLETYGSGNAPTYPWFLETLKETIDRGVCVMNVTQCANGMVDMEMYETGLRLQEIGVVSGRDITTEASVMKMMWLLGQNLDPACFVKLLQHSLRGEISE